MTIQPTIMCPKCGSMDLRKGTISYPGCITDMERYGAMQDWDHDGYQCKVCKCKFTIWDEDDEFVEEVKSTDDNFDTPSMKIDQSQAGKKIDCWSANNG